MRSVIERVTRRDSAGSNTCVKLRGLTPRPHHVAQHEMLDRLIFQEAPIGMACILPPGRFLHVNRAFCKYLGYSKRELVGKTVRDITDPTDWDQSAKAIRQLLSAKSPIVRFEKRYVHKNGRLLWGVLSARLVKDAAGKVFCIMAQVVDITEQKKAEMALQESEARFRIALQGSPTVVFMQDRHLRYTWVHNPSPRFKGDSVLGKRDSDIHKGRDARHFAKIKREVMNTGVGRRDEVVTHLKTGEMVHDMTTEPLRDKHGGIVGVICAAFDITERKLMEQRLKESHEDLERRVRERTARLRKLAIELTQAEQKERRRLAHVLHEDLQQHLVAMQYKVSELKEQQPEGPTAHTADWLLKELAQTVRLTRDLTTRLCPPVLYEFSLKAALEWLASDMKARFGLTVDIRSSGGFTLPSDAMRVFALEAVRELLMNIMKHSGARTARIRIQPATKHRSTVAVTDRGCGFDVTKPAANKFGLFSIRERAQALGAELKVVSAPGRGTCATLILPTL